MWALIGEHVRHHPEEEDHDEIVALFSTKELAKEYLEKSKLKQPKWRHKFRNTSLLSRFDDACIEEYEEPSYPIDPEL